MTIKRVRIEDISKPSEKLTELKKEDFKPLPPPFDTPEACPDFEPLKEEAKKKYESSLDDTIALSIPKPQSREEEDALVKKFISGMEKLFTKENNWTFLQPLLLSMDYCATCHTCSDSCHIYEASGRNPVYRPTYRSEIFRKWGKGTFTVDVTDDEDAFVNNLDLKLKVLFPSKTDRTICLDQVHENVDIVCLDGGFEEDIAATVLVDIPIAAIALCVELWRQVKGIVIAFKVAMPARVDMIRGMIAV